MYTVKRDGIEVYRGNQDECFRYIMRHSPGSVAWAIEHEGFTIEEAYGVPREDRGDLYPHIYSRGGMTLRDYFAAKALPALISAMMERRHEADCANFDRSAIAEATRLAYAAADDALHWRES